MCCNEVVREMAVPTGALRASRDRRAPGSLSGVCGLGRACQGLDRLWKATRPSEPTAEAWDSLWAGLKTSLDASMPKQVESPALFSSRNGSATKSNRNAFLGVRPAPASGPWR